MTKRPALAVALLLLFSCAGPDPDGPPEMSVRFLGSEGMIPSTVKTLVIDVYRPGMTMPDESQHTVANLEDNDEDGRPDVERPRLPVNVPLRILVVGQDMSGTPIYVGHVGPVTLLAGQRLYVDLALYPVGASQALTSTVYPGGIFPTATALQDGRVLVAGGFGAPTALSACPGGEPATTRCFTAMAQRDAWLFAPSDGTFRRVTGGMLAARGGHTATALTDGRVLLTSGASSLLIVVTPLGPDPTMPMGYFMDFRARDTTNVVSALASFELFDPALNTNPDDPTRTGDLGAGGFIGAADAPTTPGRMNAPRMLAAASLVARASGDLVLVAGGRESPDSWEVFDAHRAGGYGFYSTAGMTQLHSPRHFPSAITVGPATSPTVWLVGGADSGGNTDLAEIWTPAMTTGPGTTSPATSRGYPSIDGVTAMDHPEYALYRPDLALVGATKGSLLIGGWLGPRCMVGAATPTPIFVGAGGDEPCRQGVGPERSVTVDLMTGATVDTSTGMPHAFGSSATLSDGKTVVLTGGFASTTLVSQSQIDVFSGDVAMGRATRGTAHPALTRARSLHASAPLPGMGILSVGGITVEPTTMTIGLVSQAEAVYLSSSF